MTEICVPSVRGCRGQIRTKKYTVVGKSTVHNFIDYKNKGVTKMSEKYYLSILKDEPEVMTVMEAAKILRLGKNKAYDLVNSGRLSSIKVGGKIIIPKMCLVAFLTDSNNYRNNAV